MCLNGYTDTSGKQRQDIVLDAMQNMHTVRPLVQWHGMDAGHRGSGTFAEMVLELMPHFELRYPGLLQRIQVVGKRPAYAAGIKNFLLRGYPLSHKVS